MGRTLLTAALFVQSEEVHRWVLPEEELRRATEGAARAGCEPDHVVEAASDSAVFSCTVSSERTEKTRAGCTNFSKLVNKYGNLSVLEHAGSPQLALEPMYYARAEDPVGLTAFAAHWLTLWRATEGSFEDLLSLYALEATYSDPQCAEGLTGRSAIAAHFAILLPSRSEWRWTRSRIAPVLHGFVSYWEASVPVAPRHAVTVEGACLVHVRENRIARHEVIFDTRRKRMHAPPLALGFVPAESPSSRSL